MQMNAGDTSINFRMLTADIFNKYTQEYEEWFEKNKFAYLSEIEALKKVIPKGKGLEIGVGTGRFAKPLKIDVGIDPSENMLKIAETTRNKNSIGKRGKFAFCR